MTEPEPQPTNAEQQAAEQADESPKLTAEEWAYIQAVTEAQAKDAD